MNIYVLKYLSMFVYICTKREPGELAILKLVEWNCLDFLIIIKKIFKLIILNNSKELQKQLYVSFFFILKTPEVLLSGAIL